MKYFVSFLTITISVMALQIHSPSAQVDSNVAAAFKELQSPQTSDQSSERLRELATSDPKARAYLVAHLPQMIEADPKDSPGPWANAARLAGQLKIAEASSALAKWFGLEVGEITMTEFLRLDTIPAAKALSEIGDPAIPALVDVLKHGSSHERRNAYLTLNLIGSPSAKGTIRNQLKSERNIDLRNFIEKLQSGKS